MRKLWILPLFLLITSAGLLMTACGSSSSTRVRLLNAFPSTTTLDMLIAGKTVSSGVAYGAASGYTSVSSGSQTLQVEPTGSSSPLFDETINLASGSQSTILATNTAATVFTDNNTAPSGGNFSVRAIDASASLGTTDVYVVLAGTDISTVSPTFSSVGFSSASGYQSLAPGSYEVIFTLPGQKFALITTSAMSFSAGQVRTVVALDGLTGGFSTAILSDLN